MLEMNVLDPVPQIFEIAPTEGTDGFIRSKVFFYVSPKFWNTYSHTEHEDTPTATVHWHRVCRKATFREMFSEADVVKVALTEAQIVRFIQDHRRLLNFGAVTYFLFKYRSHVCVAAVFPKSDETSFGLDVYTLEDTTEWFSPLGSAVVKHA